MGLTLSTRPVIRSLADATGRSEPEIVSFLGAAIAAAVLATAVIDLVRAVDALIEAWPEPFSRARK
ncbi:MAG: hypothetical protein ACXVWU_04100 [Nocardioides sp.]